MITPGRLALRHAAFHWPRSVLLVLCVTLVFALPFSVERLVTTFGEGLLARARATPLVVGAPESRYDLVLHALYFRGRVPRPTTAAELDRLAESGLARAVPLYSTRTARGAPLVGTSLDYLDLRGLRFAAGGPPAYLGEAVVGAAAARELGLGVGDTVLTDRGGLYELSLDYPLRLRVVGVLAETGTADDGAVFVDVRTAWIVDGLGHGHAAPRDDGGDERTVPRELDPSTFVHTEITATNVDSFHFHGERDELPLTAVLVEPRDAKARTLLRGRYRVEPGARLVEPLEVVRELLGLVLGLKRFFDANALLVTVATGLFLVLLTLLSVRVREREIATLARIGCTRWTIARVFALELALLVGTGLVLALVLSGPASSVLAQSFGVVAP